MFSWFECHIKYDKTGDDGIIITTSEAYLVDAMSFTEAEARITQEMKPFINGDFLISRVKRVRIAEMFDSEDANADKWYRAKVLFVSLDEEKGVEKKVPSNMWVKAEDFKTGLDNLLKGLKTTMADYEVATLTETNILDVYNYVPLEGVAPVEN